MATLKSDHFTRLRGDLDAATADKLENCANGVPTQVQSHFALNANARGEAVRKLQEALVAIEKKDPALKLRKFSVTGVYDRDFANAGRDEFWGHNTELTCRSVAGVRPIGETRESVTGCV